jgi:recombination protein RecR
VSHPQPIRTAVRHLSKLPGVGQKTATRLVYWLLRAPDGTIEKLAESLAGLVGNVTECSICCNIGTEEVCSLCKRGCTDEQLLLVIEHPQDVLAFERTGDFAGRYHVLHGAISPLDGITPETLRIRQLLERLRDDTITEVIVATDPDVEGDATALYLSRLLRPIGVKVTRLAHGISVGTEIEYADAVSLSRALQHRTEISP